MVGNTVFINAWQDSVQEIERKKQQKGALFIACRHISTFIDGEDYIKERFIRSVDLRGQWNNQSKTVIYEFNVPLTMLNTSGGNQGDDLINEILDCKLQQIEGFSCDEVYVRIDNGYRIDYNDMAKKYI